MEDTYRQKFEYLREEYYNNLNDSKFQNQGKIQENCILDNPPPYHYSSLYSNSGVVLHYGLGSDKNSTLFVARRIF